MIFSGFTLATYNQAVKRLPLIAPLLRRFVPRKLVQNQQAHFERSFEKARKRAEAGVSDRNDFMSYILRNEDSKAMTANEIGENANILIVAGSETTATLLSGTTFLLLKHPDVYRKLIEEVRQTFKKEEDITMGGVAECKYLVAVLNEGLRLNPPSPSALGRIAPKGGDLVDEYWIPEKVNENIIQDLIIHELMPRADGCVSPTLCSIPIIT